MNFYIIVEGDVEKEVYSKWIPSIRPGLTLVDHPSKLTTDNFVIVSGGGYPFYMQIIESAIEDLRGGDGIRLVVSVDSEEMKRNEKYVEIEGHIQSILDFALDYRIVVQHCCFETWALGNKRAGPRRPEDPELKILKQFFDVMTKDPEDMPALEGLNRAQSALRYLRKMLSDRGHRVSYSKSNPTVVARVDYFDELKKRHMATQHIDSISAFLGAFA
ncbi:TPA: hypothetical protein QDC20_002136 [Burkholderia aenigmatica]|uniref:hypothetical protein n=1 Tax=Burkholderia sp. AU45251 TaxID=3059204 RepID=UPI00264E74BA|nr:hypothetical protein [Burkholderia sp. AU45251]HDR9485049.1 hypothetical protein [Burkholderia aenigmatica]MDN7517603.1 hypothetical protein [Burkholderia sp. AU45251]HDR9516596.1 hypothetical protein [Burkholderia aenigmatica]HDR9593656.1 hypothetical protein [Burkholderia aenigmatica]HDR9600256.1 hypothetical protein [Burkholderia aenigmatica]